jgi:FKBP-type peptidyl-prolyl cis-trans isomerase
MKSFQVIVLGLLVLSEVEGFVLDHSNRNARLPISSLTASSSDNHNENTRRQALDRLVTFTGVAAASVLLAPSYASAYDTVTSTVEKEGKMYSPKFVQTYDDFKESPEGWSYREVTAGKGDAAAKGDRVVFDWSG